MSPGLKPLLREGALFSGCQTVLGTAEPRCSWEAKWGLGRSAEEDQDRTGTRSGPRTPALDAAVPCPLGGSWQTRTVPVSLGAAPPSRVRDTEGEPTFRGGRCGVMIKSWEGACVSPVEASHGRHPGPPLPP